MQDHADIRKTHPVIEWKRHKNNTFLLPTYQTIGAAGFDLQAFLIEQSYELRAGEKYIACTGFDVAVPAGYELQIRSRSGLALNNEIIILNSPGTIDSDYRGEIKIGLKNISKRSFILQHGMRVAQAILSPVVQCLHREVDSLTETTRGVGGFGSTGLN